jgi:hypothetical protein
MTAIVAMPIADHFDHGCDVIVNFLKPASM